MLLCSLMIDYLQVVVLEIKTSKSKKGGRNIGSED